MTNEEMNSSAITGATPTLPPPLPKPVPRVWTALVVGVIALGAMLAVSGLVTAIWAIASGAINPTSTSFDPKAFERAVEKLASSFPGVMLLVLPGQLVMLCAAFGAAVLSKEKLKFRLGYVRGFSRWWVVPLAILGTLFLGTSAGLTIQAIFPEQSASLRMFIAMARNPGDAEFIGVLFLLSVLPAVAEESLFRGYIQRRLLQRWSPAAAIGASTVFFSLAHFDVQHTLAVIPLGAWLGYLAWRTGCLWPGMVCHAVQNALALLATRHGDPTERGLTLELVPSLGITGIGLVASVLFLRRTSLPAQWR